MNILMASTEMSPFAKTGGLGDVLGSLPLVLAGMGHRVSVVIPLYGWLDRKTYGLAPYESMMSLPVDDRTEGFQVFRCAHGPVTVYFIEKPCYYDREGIYGNQAGDYQDNAERFGFFSRAVVELAAGLHPVPGVVHCHDWPAGLVPVYLATLYQPDLRLKNTATVFTIHNVGYQGLFDPMYLHFSGLNWSVFTPEGLEFYGKMNFLKGGIVYADWVTTVSPTYAREIQTEALGHGLDGVLRAHAAKLTGILNGADYDTWSPETDQDLPCSYSPADLSGKAECKKALQARFGLPPRPDAPLVGMICRLVEQKGLGLLSERIDRLMRLDLQLVILGTGSSDYETVVSGMALRYPDRVGVKIGYDEALSHLIEAGSDMFLMPSRYEPCGLNQIYSLKYGTIPIVHATGGLQDTVIDVQEDPRRGNGFKFEKYSSEALEKAVKTAVAFYNTRKRDWRRLVGNALAADFGWERSAARYLEVYGRASRQRTGGKLSVWPGRDRPEKGGRAT